MQFIITIHVWAQSHPKSRNKPQNFNFFALMRVSFFLGGFYSSHQTKLFRFSYIVPSDQTSNQKLFVLVVPILNVCKCCTSNVKIFFYCKNPFHYLFLSYLDFHQTVLFLFSCLLVQFVPFLQYVNKTVIFTSSSEYMSVSISSLLLSLYICWSVCFGTEYFPKNLYLLFLISSISFFLLKIKLQPIKAFWFHNYSVVSSFGVS